MGWNVNFSIWIGFFYFILKLILLVGSEYYQRKENMLVSMHAMYIQAANGPLKWHLGVEQFSIDLHLGVVILKPSVTQLDISS